MSDFRTGIPGAGGAGLDIYTRLVGGAAPPPQSFYYEQEANTDVYEIEGGGGKYIQE